MNDHDAMPRPDQLRRFSVYAATDDSPDGACLAVGVEFPSDVVFATVAVQAGPMTFTDMAGLRDAVLTLSHVDETDPDDVWVDYEDPLPL